MENPTEGMVDPMRAAPSYIRERQEEFPPWTSTDRLPELFSILAPALPPSLSELYKGGGLALGEVGEVGIRAKRENLGNNEFAVELYSGLMEFFATVCITVSGGGNHTTPGAFEKPVLSRNQFVQTIAKIFTDWRDGFYSQRFKRPEIQFGSGAADTAETLETYAELFVVAHELGHIFMESDEKFDSVGPDTFGGFESYADVMAIRILFHSAQLTGKFRSAFAGALVAVRVFSFLERMGTDFQQGTHHPPPLVRLQMIKMYIRTELGSDINYARFSTVAMSIDEYLESVENFLFGKGNATEQTSEKVSARLWAILEVTARKQISEEKAEHDLLDMMDRVPEPVLKEVSDRFRSWFLTEPRDPALGEFTPLMKSMAFTLRFYRAKFPEPARTLFLSD